MSRNLLRAVLAVFGAGLAWPQSPTTPTPREVLSSALSDMRGLREIIDSSGDQSRAEESSDRGMLWFTLAGSPMLSRGGLDKLDNTPPPQERASAETVSAKRLKHRPPKAAREAYTRAARSKNAQKAAQELERAIALDPDFAEAHCNLGVAYARLNRYPEAAAEFRRAMELVPDEPLPHANLAWVSAVMGQRTEAEAHVRRALQLSPNNAAARLLANRLLIDAYLP